MKYTDEPVLEEVAAFADEAHGDQLRRYSRDRYIVHPLRVMRICQEYEGTIAVLAAAILHDVLEDTPVTADVVHSFLLTIMPRADAANTIRFVVELTDVYVRSKFPLMNRRTRKEMERLRMSAISPEAQTIKYADILDNCRDIVVNDIDFAPLFLDESAKALAVMTKGNGQLRAKAMLFIEESFPSLRGQ